MATGPECTTMLWTEEMVLLRNGWWLRIPNDDDEPADTLKREEVK